MSAWLTYHDALAEIEVPRKTMDAWRRTGRGPHFRKLPSGQLRIRRDELETWLDGLERA